MKDLSNTVQSLIFCCRLFYLMGGIGGEALGASGYLYVYITIRNIYTHTLKQRSIPML
jgi:hypothetical protein